MKLLISNEELGLLKSRALVPLKCENCSRVFYKGKNIVQTSIKGHPDFALRFCSLKCHYTHQKKSNRVILKCAECRNKMSKQKSKIVNNKYNFCSKSCSAKFQNKNKTLGKGRKSKAESFITDLIRSNFANLIVKENVRDFLPSNLEIDIYIPQINLAIEINGPLHFLPIYGKEKLEKIKGKDRQKKSEAQDMNCKFLIIDISEIKYWKETKDFLTKEYCQKINPLILNELKVTGRQGFEPR